MHSYWFSGTDILQGRWQHGEKVGYCYPSGLKKTLCKWEIYVPLVTKGLNESSFLTGAQDSHLQTVTIYHRLHIYSYDVDLLKMSRVMLETCRGF
jgi:hypothetical protein